jgi:predicted NUDIX family NTP pyrophosphohydrolase
MKDSAGVLLFRRESDEWQVLLVHPSGNYNRNKPWSIPKGLAEPGETLEQAARREAAEETGIVAGPLVLLSSIVYRKSRKRVHAFAGPAPAGSVAHCASWEVDCAEFVSLEKARRLIHPDQVPLIDQLEEHFRQI